VQAAEQDRRREAQLAARRRALPCGRPLNLVEVGEHAARARQKPLAGFGEAHRARGAVEQPHAEPRLELADRARDRGRRAAQAARGLGEAAAIRDLGEQGDAIEAIHIVADTAIMSCDEEVLFMRGKATILSGVERAVPGPRCLRAKPGAGLRPRWIVP
jgi:hypothetical protein